jgi:signal transduction histidine kinase
LAGDEGRAIALQAARPQSKVIGQAAGLRNSDGVTPSMKWDPSVRTRYLTVIFTLVLAVSGTLTIFHLSLLVNATLAAKRATEKLVADHLFQAVQQAILRQPQQEPRLAISEDATVRSLLEASSGADKEFAYCAIISADGATIAQADPLGRRQASARLLPFEELENASWHRQFRRLWSGDPVYEIATPLSLSSQPFGQIVAGVSGGALRQELAAPLRLTWIVAFALTGSALLIAVLSSGLVLRPLRELLISILQLEAESAAQGEETSEGGRDLHSVTQRLRVLGRRFAGSRTEVEAMRDQLRQVMSSLSERVILLDRERRVILASPEAERLLSGGRALRGKRLADALGVSHPLSALAERAFMARQSLQENIVMSETGAEPQTIVASLQLFAERGQPAGALLMLRDFESLQRLETQLDYASKLAALSRVTSGIAHEVKNPLNSMVLHLELLHAKLEAGLDPQTHIEILTSEVNRLNRVVQTFLDFTRPVELKLQKLDANALVREVMTLAADARVKGIEVIERYDQGPLWIQADADLLKQALLNIVINGCQAMPDGGRLIVATARDRAGLIHIAVSDQGQGIPEEVRAKIFNLYFTTKPQGSGIGLAQAFRAVQLHNGQIEVDSKIGLGTRFRLILPAA